MALLDLLPQFQMLDDPESAGRLFAPLGREEVEVAAFVYVDADRRVLGSREARSEARDSFDLPIREVVADALGHGARGVVMAHNHPSGDATPSRADLDATRRLARALDPLGIRLLDHLVVVRTGFTSLRRLGLL